MTTGAWILLIVLASSPVLMITSIALLIRLRRSRSEYNSIKNRYSDIIDIDSEISSRTKELDEIESSIDEIKSDYRDKKKIYDKLRNEVAIYDEKLSFAELGVYDPHFEFNDSQTYKDRIIKVRASQKSKVASKTATFSATDWTVDGSKSKGQTMLNRQIRLTMRAFNNECEAAIANTRWNNVNAMERRILRAAKAINDQNKSMQLEIDERYIQLKLEELYLTHEYREQIKIEKDERAELARAEREEKRLIAQAEAAEREERRYQEMLNKARREAGADNSADMLSRIKELENALAEAKETSERARAMAELTRSGYVYVISNVGSFGEDVFKIGLTRRLDPDDRVRELGDASVPFGFDTHAMIYSDEAPNLESALHREFSDRRINIANTRKEFFRVTLGEVESAVKKLAPDAPFFRDIEAQEWHETIARRKEALNQIEKQEFPDSI